MNVSVGFALMLLTIVRCQLDSACLPWGLRLAYGEYYTPQGGTNQIYVSFNTYVLTRFNGRATAPTVM